MAVGYSGLGVGKNNPQYQDVKGIGPIPVGLYTIEAPENTTDHGPYALRLTPYPANRMYGRSEFLIHGDSFTHPGAASEGCIILPLFARQRVWESGDHTLQVLAKVGDKLDTEPGQVQE